MEIESKRIENCIFNENVIQFELMYNSIIIDQTILLYNHTQRVFL